MPIPTETSLQDQIGKIAKLIDDLREFAALSTPSYLSDEDDIIAAMDLENTSAATAALAGQRAAYAGMISQSRIAGLLDPYLEQYAAIIDSLQTAGPQIMADLSKWMVDTGQTIQTRNFVYGSPTASGINSGDGVIFRLSIDKYGNNMEAGTPDAKRAICTKDQFTGARRGAEEFTFEGEAAFFDSMRLSGSGETKTANGLTAADSNRYVGNASFDNFGGTASSPTVITQWEASVIGNFAVDQTTTYRDFPGAGTSGALKFKTNASVTQDFRSAAGLFDEDIPVHVQIAYNASAGAGNGILTLTFGAKSVSVNVSGAVGWNVLSFPLDETCFYDGFKAAIPQVIVALASRTTGTLLVDDLVIGRMTLFDGTWYAVVGGADPFLVGDRFDWEDSAAAASASIIQTALVLGYDSYLPAASSASWSDP